MRRKASLAAALGLGLTLAAAGCNNATEGVTIFEAQLSGANEVPARNTAANGAAASPPGVPSDPK